MASAKKTPERDSLAYLRHRLSLMNTNKTSTNSNSSAGSCLNSSGSGSVTKPSSILYPLVESAEPAKLSRAETKETKIRKTVSESKLPPFKQEIKRTTVAMQLKSSTTKSSSDLPGFAGIQEGGSEQNKENNGVISKPMGLRRARDSLLQTRQKMKKPPLPKCLSEIDELPDRPASEAMIATSPADYDTRDVLTEPQTNSEKERSRSHSRERSALNSKSSMSLCSSKEDILEAEKCKQSTNEIVYLSPVKMAALSPAVKPVSRSKSGSPPPRPKSSANTVYGESGYMSASTSALPNPLVTPARSMPALASVAETPQVQQIQSTSKNETISVNSKVYQVLNLLGRGGSSKVYMAFDVELNNCVAIKIVDLCDAEPVVRKGYENEIKLLSKLQHSDKVIKLYDYELRGDLLFVVMEKGDRDLAAYLKERKAEVMNDPIMIKFYWAEMLKATQVIHKQGIVHSDLKPANFLLVGGNLKLIDFGIAAAVPNNKTAVTRECQMGTVNYMSPETIRNSGVDDDVKSRVTTKSDIWSLGCILYSMTHGKTPFSHITNFYTKILAIVNEEQAIKYKQGLDPLLMDTLKLCLRRTPTERPTVEQLLQHQYLAKGPENPSRLKISEADLLHALSMNSPNTRERIAKQILGSDQ